MDKLNGDFNRGYTKALSDLKGWLDRNEEWLKVWKIYPKKSTLLLLDGIIRNRDTFRELGVDTKLTFVFDEHDHFTGIR